MNREERILKYINTADEFVFSGKRYYENDFYNDVEDLVKENQELKRKLNESIHKATEFGSEVYELKKQLEEWNHHLKCSKEMLDIQGHNGNYNYDSYMLGIYNGMEYIIALFETREPIFKSGKDIEFISDKTQQKEYIDRISRVIEYINHYETIRGYYEYEEDGYDEYNYEDDLKQELLEIIGDKK